MKYKQVQIATRNCALPIHLDLIKIPRLREDQRPEKVQKMPIK